MCVTERLSWRRIRCWTGCIHVPCKIPPWVMYREMLSLEVCIMLRSGHGSRICAGIRCTGEFCHYMTPRGLHTPWAFRIWTWMKGKVLGPFYSCVPHDNVWTKQDEEIDFSLTIVSWCSRMVFVRSLSHPLWHWCLTELTTVFIFNYWDIETATISLTV